MIHQTEVLTPGLAYAIVSRRAYTRVFLAEQPDWRPIRQNDVTRPVGRAVIDDNELQVAERLVENAADCLGNISLAVIGWDDD